MKNTNALEAAALDRIRELVEGIRPLIEGEDFSVISAESMDAILEVQSIVSEEDLSFVDDVDIDFDEDLF
jgi:hypothetical protein